MVVDGQRHITAALLPGKRLGTPCTKVWVGLGAGQDRYGKSRPPGIQTTDRPARNESLYWLCYPSYR